MLRWRRLLEDRALPPAIVAAAPEPPFAFSPPAFARHTRLRLGLPPRLAMRRALEALPPGGTVLDVGVGTGSASLVLAPKTARIIGVDVSDGMLTEFRRLAAELGVPVETVLGSWPEVAGGVPSADVAVCDSVLYGAADIGAFAGALSTHARHRVVIVIPDVQWLGWQDDLWLRFHGVRRARPATAADAVDALVELGIPVHREDERLRSPYGFDTRHEALADARRRLCLLPEQDIELAASLGDRLREENGRWVAGPPEAEAVTVTLWWDTAVG